MVSARIPRITVAGGGLAGMLAALRLAQLGHDVTLYEASNRLGGKAGATQHGSDFDEHGYHFFPMWYRNTWRLVDELKIGDRFIDVEGFYHAHPGEFPDKMHKMANLGSIWSLWTNLTSGVLPFWDMVLFLYSNIDLASHHLDRTRLLDQISTAGFIHSRWYGSDIIAQQHQELVLKGISEPSYFVSAKTMQKVIQFWFRYANPMHRILKGNLQQELIAPIQRQLECSGVVIKFNKRVEQVVIQCDEAAGVRVARQIQIRDSITRESDCVDVDQLILTVPLEQLRTLLSNDDLYAGAPELFGVQHLRTAPMAALNLYLNRRLPRVPRAHVNLVDSRYGLSFIDVSQFWPGYDNTVLNLIASDFTSIQSLSDEEAIKLLVADLRRFLTTLRDEDIDHPQLMSNVNEQLFMNDVGVWHYRPAAKTAAANLFVAGDYCRSYVDLVSMEGAITTGLLAAEAVRKRAGLPIDALRIDEAKTHPRYLFVALKWLLSPIALVAKLATLGSPRTYHTEPKAKQAT